MNLLCYHSVFGSFGKGAHHVPVSGSERAAEGRVRFRHCNVENGGALGQFRGGTVLQRAEQDLAAVAFLQWHGVHEP